MSLIDLLSYLYVYSKVIHTVCLLYSNSFNIKFENTSLTMTRNKEEKNKTKQRPERNKSERRRRRRRRKGKRNRCDKIIQISNNHVSFFYSFLFPYLCINFILKIFFPLFLLFKSEIKIRKFLF